MGCSIDCIPSPRLWVGPPHPRVMLRDVCPPRLLPAGTYDRRTKQQKVEPAVEVVGGGARGGGQGSGPAAAGGSAA